MRDNFTMIPSVPVTDIKLDVQNFRYYGELSNQDDCIKAMLDDPKSGIYELAEDIAQNGLTPDPIVLFKDEDGDWIGGSKKKGRKWYNNDNDYSDWGYDD